MPSRPVKPRHWPEDIEMLYRALAGKEASTEQEARIRARLDAPKDQEPPRS